MANRNDEAGKSARSLRRRLWNAIIDAGLGEPALWKSLCVCFFCVVFFYLAKSFSDQHKWSTVSEVFLHITIAFMVAAILTLTLEFNARRRIQYEIREFEEKISKNVFEGVLGHGVPPPVLDEIKEILRKSFIRETCKYVITLKPPAHPAPGFFLIERSLRFTARNLENRSSLFNVRSYYAGGIDPDSEAWKGNPFHLELKVEKTDIPLEIGKNIQLKDGRVFLEHKVPLEPYGSATIFLRGEEPCRVEAGTNSYMQSTMVHGIEVQLVNNYTEVIKEPHVLMHHPAWDPPPSDEFVLHYALDRVFFPGQGFEVKWKVAGECFTDADRE